MKKLIAIMSAVVMIFAFTSCQKDTPVSSDTPKEPTKAPAQETEAPAEATEAPVAENQETKATEKILIYISGPEAMINKLEEQFEEQNGDVCDFVKMSCGQIRSKVWAEKEACKIQADVIWGSDPLIYNKLDDAELLMPLKLKDADSINEQFKVSDRNYALVNERYITIVYNKDQLKETPPTSFKDLTDKKYDGMVVKADANQSSTAFAIATSLYQLTGENSEYFQSLKDNNVMLAKSNGQVPSKIMEGQFAVGIAPHDGIVRLRNKGKKEEFDVPLEIVWPKEGVIGIQRPIAIVKDDTRSKEEQAIASKLVNFLLSKKAQTITTKFGFVSVRTDIENTYLPEGVEVYKIDWDKATQNEQTIKQEYQNIFHK
jgi:iron(III) transport system substrate-binding protein